MRFAVATAVLLVLAGHAAAGPLDAIGMLSQLQDGGNLFPAGFPQLQNAYAVKPYVAPPVPENAYRGVYVSSRLSCPA